MPKVLAAARDTRTEISMRLQLGRYLAVEAARKVPDALPRAAEHLKLADAAAGAIEFARVDTRRPVQTGALLDPVQIIHREFFDFEQFLPVGEESVALAMTNDSIRKILRDSR